MKKLLKAVIITLVLSAFPALPQVVLSEEYTTENEVQKEEKKELEDMVVTATKIEELKKDVSASVQVIGSEDIKNSTAKDAGDLIAEAGVGHVTNYGGAYTSTIEIRGLTTDGNLDPFMSRVLVLINGNRAGTVNFSTIPADDIERIEIVKGPASVLYGSSAMGGVINIITKQGRKEGIHGSVGGEIGSWDYWKTGIELTGKKDSFDYYVMGNRSKRGDYDTPDFGTIVNSGYKKETISTRFGYRFQNDHHVSLGFQHHNNWDVGSQGATYSPEPDDYNSKKRDGFDIGYNTHTFNAGYYFAQEISKWYMGAASGNPMIWENDVDTQGINAQKSFPIGDHRIVIGGQWDRIEYQNRVNTTSPYQPDVKNDNYGAYSEGRLSLFDNKLLVSGGLRYDSFDNETLVTEGLTTVVPKSEHLDHWTPRGGIVYNTSVSGLSFKGNAGTAFRVPAPMELAIDYLYYGTHYVGNPNLRPEKSTTYDAGIYYTKHLLKADLTFFHTNFEDKIVSYYDTARTIMTYKNVDGATIQGIELNASYDIGTARDWPIMIEPFTNITYKTKYDQKNEGESDTTMTYTPKWTGAFGIKAGQHKWDARLIGNYIADEEVTDWNPSSATYNQTIVKDGFLVVNLKGSYRPVKQLELTVSIENLFDKEYEYNLGYPRPGMTVIGGIKWLF